MRELTSRALDTATALGATYADVRVVRQLEEAITIKSGRLEGVAGGESEGFGVRVLVDGAWGFAASHSLSTAEADRVAAEAVRIARASATAIRRPRRPRRAAAGTGSLRDARRGGPVRGPAGAQDADLMAADEALRRVDGIAWTESMYAAQRDEKTFAASDGSYTEQVITHVGAGLEANVIDGDEHQRRSYPDNGGLWASAGYEHVRAMDLAGNAERIAEEARELIAAPPLPPGRADDRPPPEPAVHAGPRELRPPDRARPRLRHRGELRRHELPDAGHAGHASATARTCATSSPTRPCRAAWARFGWDDEGVAAQSRADHQGGDVRRLPARRETAPRIGRQSGGAMRADGWNRIPLIRMTNVNLLPRPGMTFEDIVADTDDGLLFETNRSAGRSTTAGSTSSSRRRSAARSRAARSASCTATAPTPASRTSCGGRWTPSATRSLADVGHAELRQGRAGPDRPRRPRRVGRAVPERPGGGDG